MGLRVGGLEERETGLKKKNHFSSFFCIASSEEEERGTVPFKTVPFGPLSSSYYFFFFCMKRRRFRQNAPFHLSPARRQNASICKAALNYLLFISIVSLPISVFAPLVGRVFHFSPWPLIYAIEPLIDQKTSNFFN